MRKPNNWRDDPKAIKYDSSLIRNHSSNFERRHLGYREAYLPPYYQIVKNQKSPASR